MDRRAKFIRDFLDGKLPRKKYMSNHSKDSGVVRIRPGISEAVDGGTGTTAHQDRIEEIIDVMTGRGAGHELGQTPTEDKYGGKGPVSIEGAADKQTTMQQKLDEQVVDENRFPEDPEHVTRRGLPPCKRVDDEEGTDHTPGRRK